MESVDDNGEFGNQQQQQQQNVKKLVQPVSTVQPILIVLSFERRCDTLCGGTLFLTGDNSATNDVQ